MATVLSDPGLQPLESFSAQRIEPHLAVGAHLHDASLGEDSQMPRHTGLLNVHAPHDVADGTFARLHDLDDSKPGWIGESLKHVNLRFHVYT